MEPDTTAELQQQSQPPPYEASQQVAYPGYPPAAQHNVTTNTTVVAQPTIVMATTLGPVPVGMICPHCQAQIVTSTSYEPGTLTWLACVVDLLLLGVGKVAASFHSAWMV
ncbi:Hypothetical predicted protein [Paramuricea clavata]|uniref:Uncharacterized protein n=1 Tax=Paramuricea clavata TaxID=317549 RepID=A0A6S7G0L7_PARCT|nr:Hypothetical predicted protein [Paramuricea clavata]